MMITATRRYEFDAAHRIPGHPKCGNVHGHRYAVEITVTGQLNNHGMIIDFGEMDATIGKWINDTFDHAYIHQNGDIAMKDYTGKSVCVVYGTTVEHLAQYILSACAKALPVQITNVRVYESNRSWCDVVPS